MLTRETLAERRQLCATCPTPCAGIVVEDGRSRCPLRPPRWGKAPLGLGDVVAAVAQPVAHAIDAVAGTHLARCGGCTGPGGRKERLNEAMPDVLRPLRRGARKPPATPVPPARTPVE